MKKRLGWLILCQVISLILGAVFYHSVREELKPALIRQGVAKGRYEQQEELKKAQVEIPENLDMSLPDKEAYIAPGMIALSQTVFLVIPAALLQLIAIGVATRSFVAGQDPAGQQHPESNERQAEQDV